MPVHHYTCRYFIGIFSLVTYSNSKVCEPYQKYSPNYDYWMLYSCLFFHFNLFGKTITDFSS